MSLFRSIATAAIQKAEKVDCPLGRFAEGLEEMIEVIQDRLSEVTGELQESES